MPIARFTLRPDDMIDAWRWSALNDKPHKRARWQQTLAIPVLVSAFVMIAPASGAPISGSLFAASILLIAFGWSAWHIWSTYPQRAAERMARQWKKIAPADAMYETELEISLEAVRFRSANVDALFQWNAFTEYCDLPSCIVMWRGRTGFVLVPKRSITETEKGEMLRILSEKLRAA